MIVSVKGKVCEFNVINREILMKSEHTGNIQINLGNPDNFKKTVLTSRNRFPKFVLDYIDTWKEEDILKVRNMETDKEMEEDMLQDFKELGYEIIKE